MKGVGNVKGHLRGENFVGLGCRGARRAGVVVRGAKAGGRRRGSSQWRRLLKTVCGIVREWR